MMTMKQRRRWTGEGKKERMNERQCARRKEKEALAFHLNSSFPSDSFHPLNPGESLSALELCPRPSSSSPSSSLLLLLSASLPVQPRQSPLNALSAACWNKRRNHCGPHWAPTTAIARGRTGSTERRVSLLEFSAQIRKQPSTLVARALLFLFRSLRPPLALPPLPCLSRQLLTSRLSSAFDSCQL